MLERSTSKPPRHRPQLIGSAENTVSPQDVAAFLRRSTGSVAVAILICTALGAAYLFAASPEYIASAQVIIEPQKPQQLLREETGVIDLTLNNARMDSHLEVLRSEKISLSVITNLRLLEDAEFVSAGRTEMSELERLHLAQAKFNSRTDVRRVGQSYIIQISFRSERPDKAAEIANAIANTYVNAQLQDKMDEARRGREWLEERINELRKQLHSATHAVQDFRSRGSGSVDPKSALDAEVTLSELESTVATYRKIYENVLQRLVESVQTESFLSPDARVLATASRYLARSSPNPKLVLALSVLLGGLFGLAVAAARGALDQRVRSPSQITRDLGIDCLGGLPFVRKEHSDEMLLHEAVRFPQSPFADALRRIKTAIETTLRQKPTRSIGILSLAPGEGATTVAANLAAVFVKAGQRTILVDANFRNPTLSRILAPSEDVGLLEMVNGGAAASTIRDPLLGIEVLPIARNTQCPNSNDLLGSDAMRELIVNLQRSFKMIIIDLPPFIDLADALAIAPNIDSLIVVCQSSKTPLGEIVTAADALTASDAQLLGVIVNKEKDGGQIDLATWAAKLILRKGRRTARAPLHSLRKRSATSFSTLTCVATKVPLI
jgi:capsular exopolysaccharide synthesis family protein